MRRIFVAAFAFAGFILTPAIASARPPAVTVQVSPVGHRDYRNVDRTPAIKLRVERALQAATNDLTRGQRLRLVTARQATALRAEIRGIRAQLRQALRFDGQIRPVEASRLEASLDNLTARVAEAMRPGRRHQLARR